MSFLTRLFGPKEPPPPPRDAMALARPLAQPALHLRAASEAPSFLGGLPALPEGVAWPARDGGPLTFVASLDLPSLQAALPAPWLPSSGRLLFFYDAENQPWGFDPKDRGSWSVMHVDEAVAHNAASLSAPVLTRQAMTFEAIDTYPSWERAEVQALELTDAEAELLSDGSVAVYRRLPMHQVGGFPQPVQGDQMELECQLVSHGLYCGDSSGYLSREATGLRAGFADWRLLLQIDTDDGLGVMWGDAGVLYFWSREQDARAGRFDQAWVVLHCS
jgi:uncharacterized protein YwqG